MIEETMIDSNELAFSRYNFRLKKAEPFDEMPVEEVYIESEVYIRSIRDDSNSVRGSSYSGMSSGTPTSINESIKFELD